MDKIIFDPEKFYRIVFAEGQPIDFRVKESHAEGDSVLCEKKGGETFYLDTMEPYEKIVEVEGW